MADDVPEGIEILVRNLLAVLNEAATMGVAIVPDVDPEGVSYSIEWQANGKPGNLTIAWDIPSRKWAVSNG